MASAAVLSVATYVGPAMATHGCTTATVTAYSVSTSTSIAVAIYGNQPRMPRHSTAISTAILPRQVPGQYAAIATALPGNYHGNFHGRPSTAISTETHGIPRPSARQFPHYTVTSTAISTGGNLRQLTRQTTAFRGDYHGNFRDN